MINVEGYKAFHGDMRLVPKNSLYGLYICDKDWLYKPEYDCWYGDGRSFPAEVCEPIENNNMYRDE